MRAGRIMKWNTTQDVLEMKNQTHTGIYTYRVVWYQPRIFLGYNATVTTTVAEEGRKSWRKVGAEECNGGTAV